MRARLQVLPRTGVTVRVHHTRLYHASPIVQRTNLRNGEVVPNPFAPKPTPTARPIPNIYELVDRRATGSSDDSVQPRQQQRFSKEDVSDWLQKMAGRLIATMDRSFPLDEVKDISSASEFETLVARGLAGAPEAMLFLARSRMRLERLPLEEQRPLAAAACASRILAWVLQTDRRYWDTILPDDFIKLLCWHIEAEDKSHVVEEWIATYLTSVEMQKGAVRAHNPFRRALNIRWPSQALVGLIQGKIHWQADGSATAALECLLRAFDRGFGQLRDVIFLPSAMIELEKTLLRDETPPCSPILFDRYCSWLPTANDCKKLATRLGVASHLATVALYHSTNADPRPILLHFQKKSQREHWFGRQDRTRQHMANDLLRASYLLRLEDDNAAARSLEDISRRLHPKPSSQLPMLYDKWKDDPKLRNHHSRSVYGKSLRPY
ncbi:unnamed protein product [Cercospora beticola]|nr:unnamed protein product [Cercospora beticola]